MTAIRRIASARPVLMAASAAFAALSLLACSSGLDDNNEDLPTPAIAQGEAVSVCGSPAGSASVTLSDIGTAIIEGAPNQLPVNRVRLVGTSTGLDPATHSVFIFLVPISTDCPAYEQGIATLQADGTFSGDLELDDDLVSLRAVAVAGPIGTTVSCASTDSCVNVAGQLAFSNALEIRP